MGSNECASSGDLRSRLRRAIEAYVRDHPNASDTLAGIGDWWIPPELCPAPGDLEAVLDALVSDNVLQRTVLIDRSEVYSVRRRTTGKRD